jgi:hypothetical protein
MLVAHQAAAAMLATDLAALMIEGVAVAVVRDGWRNTVTRPSSSM